MIKLEVVTGYCVIPGHVRTSAEYGAWGAELFPALKEGGIVVRPFYKEPIDLWLYRHILTLRGQTIAAANADNPAKNSLPYHCCQHQKFAWLAAAALLNHEAETFVWLDYGILHSIPGVTKEIVIDFLNKIRKDDFAIPGCWGIADKAKTLEYPLEYPNWRFCGGLLVVPRECVQPLFHAVREEIKQIIEFHRIVTFEVNTLARCEAKGTIRPRWFSADHNERMFSGY